MTWENLLSLKRYGDTQKRARIEQDETRLGFDVDYDRIIFSEGFRSLQDKTQVIPLSKKDFVHTRLTHSLEVSVVGRSLGRKIGKLLLKKYPDLGQAGYSFTDFGAIVAAAALAHDIGNPPFGHSGEKAIGEYFSRGKGVVLKDYLTDAQWQDLIDFEGNANGFKMVVDGQVGGSEGIRLSYATLGAFMKYPKAALPKKPSKDIVDKKYGFFQDQQEFATNLMTDLGMHSRSKDYVSYNRHPLAFLVEAADDICYTIIDFEDGINLGWIDEEYALEYMIKIVKDRLDREKYWSMHQKASRVAYLRAIAIGVLIDEAVSIFMENEEAILKGEYQQGLMDKCAFEAQIKDIIKLSVEKIYKSPVVIEKEVAGYKVIHDLLDSFLKSVLDSESSSYQNLILDLFPTLNEIRDQKEIYKRILNTCTYVASFSDGQAIEIHKKISGMGI
ncbi:dNTP triphosphohydrolase [Flavobacteriaceae bacterium]|nr:dNTP triphosphohydrolase [Flavobacteriaceae bacterium]